MLLGEQFRQLDIDSKQRILKAYYNKDALDSVAKSLLTIHDEHEKNNVGLEPIKLNETSSFSSLSSTSISQKCERDHYQKQSSIILSKTPALSSSASCILFLDSLVEKNLLVDNITVLSKESTSGQKQALKTSFSFKDSLKNVKNVKLNQAPAQIGKYIAKLKSGSSNTSLVSRVKSVEVSNISSSYSNISSSESHQCQNKKNLPIEYAIISSNDQLDRNDSRIPNKMFTQNGHQFHPKPAAITSSYNNQNFYNQNLLLSKKLRKHLPNNLGLKNHGNTCFMNCILQCLFHTSPLADFFITEQFEQDMQVIVHQHKTNKPPKTPPQFILTKHFYRLLNSMWWNTYESNFSQELKHLIGHLNPTFSGGNQNDSHELCVCLLDKLSEELSLKIPAKVPISKTDSGQNHITPPTTSSFVEELFQVEFKSTVICSKCNYRSSKYETDMMLSLPLPQNQVLKKPDPSNNLKRKRRFLYPSLILVNQTSIKNMTSNDNSDQESKSKFYVSPSNHAEKSTNSDNTHTFHTPFHAKIGCNIQLTNDTMNGDGHATITDPAISAISILNPNLLDLRRYVSIAYHLRSSDLVFIDLNHIEKNLNDDQTIRETFFSKSDATTQVTESMCVMELYSPTGNKTEPRLPLINVIGINVYFEESSGSRMPYGIPFVLLINRDCSYSELCRKLLEAQSKYFKDKNMLKYKDLVEKLFCLSLNDSGRNFKLNSTDDLPLYAECVEQAIEKSQGNNVEFIKINIEWRSLEGISNLFKDIDYDKAEFIHKSFRHLKKIETDTSQVSSDSTMQPSNTSHFYSSTVTTTTLDNCFELFTEREHLTDENSWMCPKCQKQTNAYKNLCISQVPPILIIHLKRFFYKSKTSNFKLTKPVWFPVNNLDISRYIDKPSKFDQPKGHTELNGYESSDCEGSYDLMDAANKSQTNSKDEDYMYDLFSVVNHRGTNMANGHYTAFCKNLVDTKWYCFDDATCTPLSDPGQPASNILNNGSNQVWTEHAYILFYKKRNCMRNERWWTNYIDRVLYEHDEFDRFLHNLDQIEEEQKRQQEAVQTQQHRIGDKVQVVSNTKHNLNSTVKKHTGLNKIRNMLSAGSKKDNETEKYNTNSEYQDNQDWETNTEVKHYDETNKPNRLLKQSPVKSAQGTSNVMTLNAITDLPSSDSNSSLNNYTTNPRPLQSCFKSTQIVPSDDIFEQRPAPVDQMNPTHPIIRLSSESNQLYRYPPDNDYVQVAKNNLYEFQPSNRTKKLDEKRNGQLSPNGKLEKNSSPSSGSSLSGRSVVNRSVGQNSKYINPATIETPI